MDVKYLVYQINALASELAEAGWKVDMSEYAYDGCIHVVTSAMKDGVQVESPYVYPKEATDEQA